jgi:hypothetical protein
MTESRARVKLRIDFDKENGFEATATLSKMQAEEIATLFWKAVEDARRKSP